MHKIKGISFGFAIMLSRMRKLCQKKKRFDGATEWNEKENCMKRE